ncbi:cytochrome b-c1 complex subunit 2, mitochondrial-like [Acanthaster planci]|uniref:Cytochrome b-c1 complex subunit 2, mitochondrial-like n=1 Tax=Acanthaster planci TaxID=133434 RepID=A0A8B7Y864_ACAPL|nr:cytochrome b-c1 complex subunit 2, mitochondrial-like [Acanthaster planci]
MMSMSGLRPVFAGLSRRLYAAQVATATQSADKTPLPQESVQVSKLNNGLTVASLENHSPVSRIGLLVSAGCRYENTQNLGITHCLRSYANLTTSNATTFKITRGLDDIGASLEATTTRDHMLYSVQCLRTHIDTAASFLQAATTGQQFRPWEIKDYRQRVLFDLASVRDQLQIEVLENLHAAAFRDTVGRSLYAPEYMVDKIGTEMLLDYVNNMYTAENTALVGIGVDHGDLKSFGEKFDVKRGVKTETPAAKYAGGEIRTQRDSPYSYAAVAVQGASLSSKELLTLGVLQQLMGVGPYIKWGSQQASSKLNQAAGKATMLPFSASCFNMSYSDTGLFGIFAVTQGDQMGTMLKSMVGQMGAITKGNIEDKDLTRAKNQLKAAILMNLENQSTIFEDIGVQALCTGDYVTPAAMIAEVDAITGQDALQVAKRIFNGKLSMAASGDLGNTPYLDQLLSA